MAKPILFNENAHRALKRGISQVVEAIRPTLGPLPRAVAIQRPAQGMAPELLDSGAMIARRITELPTAGENTGAMLIRGLLWRIYEEAGDGTATAAVIFDSIFQQGHRAIAAGFPALPLREAIERHAEPLAKRLADFAFTVDSVSQLTAMAATTGDPELAPLLGEALDTLGMYGQIELRQSHHRQSRVEYLLGQTWAANAITLEPFVQPADHLVTIFEPAILISDVDILDPRDLVPAMKLAIQSRAGGIVFVLRSVSETVRTFIQANHRPGTFAAIAMQIPGFSADGQAAALQDLSLLLDGKPFRHAASDSVLNIAQGDLGRARRITLSKDRITVFNGAGDPHLIVDQIHQLEAHFARAVTPEERTALLSRLGRFSGGIATILIGAGTDSEAKARIERAVRTTTMLRHLLRDGAIPGGGSTLVLLAGEVRAGVTSESNEIERVAAQIVANALDAPLGAIAANAGHHPPLAIARVRQAQAGTGFDARSGDLVDVAEHGIADPLTTVQIVVERTVRSAAQALTIDAIIHTGQQAESMIPG